ncbi:MAG: hypothetical protein P8Y29_10860 [Gemmatimonadota bacterium]|jgi:hypothetical protein
MERRIVMDDLDCRLASPPGGQDSDRVVSVTVNGETIGRVRASRDLSELSEDEMRTLVRKARREAALERWEGEGGNPHPDAQG